MNRLMPAAESITCGIQGMGRGCLFEILDSRTVNGSSAPLPRRPRQRSIALVIVRSSSSRNPSSRNTMRLPLCVSITTSCQQRKRIRSGGA